MTDAETFNPRGQFASADDAFKASAELRAAVHEAGRDGTDTEMRAAMRGAAQRYVLDALRGAGIELGAYDLRIAAWVADWDGETIVTILDWVLRARQTTTTPPAESEPTRAACGRCGSQFDPTDTSFDGRARYAATLFCRGCVDQCHEADADHRCIICIAGGAR